MDATEKTKLQVEAWRTTVQVQQHFNDIEMKVRTLAITVLTAVLGAAAIAIKDGTKLDVFGHGLPLGSALLFVGLFTWILFYGVDQIWYHRLLMGAVRHGEALEDMLAEELPGFALTKRITHESPYQPQIPFTGKKIGKPIHSKSKLLGFYWGVGLLLALAVVLSAVGTLGTSNDEKATDKNAASLLRAHHA